MAWTDKYVIAGGLGSADGSSEANAWDWAAAITHSASNTDVRYNCKASTKSLTTTSLTFNGVGTTSAPNWWRGYKTTIGDMDDFPTTQRVEGTDIPLLTATTGSFSITGAHQWFSSIHFRCTGAVGQRAVSVGSAASKSKFAFCRFENQEAGSTSYALRASADGLCFFNCWMKATGTAGHVVISEEAIFWLGGVFRGGGNGILHDMTGRSGGGLIFCIFDNNGDDAIELTGTTGSVFNIVNPLIYKPGGHGINVTTGIPAGLIIINPAFHSVTGASKYGVNLVSGSATPMIVGPSWYNVNTKTNNVTESQIWCEKNETVDPYPNAANHDFTPYGSALLIGTSAPQLFENETYKSYGDRGAVQIYSPTDAEVATVIWAYANRTLS